MARAVYAENLSSRYLNTVLVAGVKARVRQVVENPELRPLRIMEAGAGVGASTASIVEWLRSVDAFTPDEWCSRGGVHFLGSHHVLPRYGS
ncbi:MAG: hypothetical protein U1U88_001186 [Lawsonella clevelandensis]